MKSNYLIGYLTREYAKDLCYLYLFVFAINLTIALITCRCLSPFELFFTDEPLIYMGFYFGTVIAWNYTKEEDLRSSHNRRSVIYFKSVGFLYLTMVVINLVSTLYTGATIDLYVLVVNNNHKFYTISLLYGIFELYDACGHKVK